MWVKKLYTGSLAIPSLFLNRRRNDLELRRTREGTYIFSSSAGSGASSSSNAFDDVVDDNSQDTQDTNLTQDGAGGETPLGAATPSDEQAVPMIYACATMWHEEEDEMKALFKSIFR